MSQASATKLISKLRFKVHERRKLSNPEGPVGRHNKIRKIVTALYRHERLEMNYNVADEARGYAERLLSDAIRYGDTHKPTMDLVSYWVIDKPTIHKLFKVLAPRYKDFKVSYTKLWRAPNIYPGTELKKCVLELRDNIYPPLEADQTFKKNLIHNILLEEAKKAYMQEKGLKEKEKSDENHTTGTSSSKDHLGVKENVQLNEATDKNNIEYSETEETDIKSELPDEENLKADSESAGESKEKVEENYIKEENLDLSKMSISEEKQAESPNDEGKK